jgi:hypothetical protein
MSTDEQAGVNGAGAAFPGAGPPALIIEGVAVVAAGLISVGVMLWGLGQETQAPAWAVAGLLGLLATWAYAIMRIH